MELDLRIQKRAWSHSDDQARFLCLKTANEFEKNPKNSSQNCPIPLDIIHASVYNKDRG